MTKSDATVERAGWPIPQWCEAVAFSRATFYNLPPERRPRSIKLGKRHIIIEPPAQYMARLAAAQGVA